MSERTESERRTEQIHLRMPPALYARVKVIAGQQGVSVNQTITLLLASATAGFQFNTEAAAMTTTYPIARVGTSGQATHLLDPNGRVRCENHMSEKGAGISGPYLRQDANGRYRDTSLVSEIHPLGTASSFSCHWCNLWVDDKPYV